MTRKRDVHLLSFARMFFTEAAAIEVARTQGILVKPFLTAVSIVFIVAPRREYKDTWMDRREGYFYLRGQRAKGSAVLHQPDGKVGSNSVEGKEAAKRPKRIGAGSSLRAH